MKISNLEEYKQHQEQNLKHSDEYWREWALSFEWITPFKEVFSGNLTDVNFKWFKDGELNITQNCLDRHVKTNPERPALVFEPNSPEEDFIHYNYQELLIAVNKASNMLKGLGVKKGDRVCLYMGMVPELLIAVLACARIGAIHSVVFGGFSAQALADRLNDAQAILLITSDGSFRGDKSIPLKSIADEALKSSYTVKKVLVHQRIQSDIKMLQDRDFWWHDLIQHQDETCPVEKMNSEDPLFILYTSGSTGKPKGIVHSTAGYMIWAQYTFEQVFQVRAQDKFWCTADIGWITGHSYLVYGPLLSGKCTYMFEGVPTWPDQSRFWQIIEKHKISHFYTAPTAIRALMAKDPKLPSKFNLSSLKVLGTVGEPINEEAWQWYYDVVGGGKCPIVDTWWQTETGGIMISSLAGITPSVPMVATNPLPGVKPVLMDSNGKILHDQKAEGNLCIEKPWPGMARTIWNDHERFVETYFSTYPGYYFTGDGAKRDGRGFYRITGRVDDVINVSGHRFGTAEIEDALDLMPEVVETAVVGYPHAIKGQGIYAYVVLKSSIKDPETFLTNAQNQVCTVIGAIAKPDHIQIVVGLPKTRSGKIMRRILRKVAEGKPGELGDTSTLLDPNVVEDIIKGAQLS